MARGCLLLLAFLLGGCACVLPGDAAAKLIAHPDHLPDAGPDEVVEPTGWTSPAALAERLNTLVNPLVRPPASLQEAQR